MWVRLGILGAATALASACYHPTAQVGLPCSPNHTCPGDQVCDLNQSPPTCVDELGGQVDAALDGPIGTACASSAACPSDAPVCDPDDKICRACVADSECDGACHELTGHCIAEANVLYVSPAGADNLTCAKALPCASVNAALQRVTAMRAFLRVADGSYPGGWSVKQQSQGQPTVIISGTDLAPGGAEFAPSGSGGDLQVDPSASLVLEGVTIKEAGLVLRGPTTVSHVTIEAAPLPGIDVRAAGSLILLDSVVEGSQGVGVTSASSVELQRSQILGNTGGGISASGAFTIVNTVIANNGAQFGAMYGGARLAPILGKPAVFRFNTVTKNSAGGMSAGVQCEAAVSVEDSIIYGNMSLLLPELGMSCAPTYCVVPSAATGTNIQGNPMFVNAASDFHLMAGSPAIDAADPTATEAVDFEGGGRPRGAARDIGADEQP